MTSHGRFPKLIGLESAVSIPFVAVFPQEFPHDIPNKMPPARPFPAAKYHLAMEHSLDDLQTK